MKIPESLRSTLCPNISLFITKDALGLLALPATSRHAVGWNVEEWFWGDILKANIEWITSPFRIFLHKAKECSLCSIHLLQMHKDYFRYSRTQQILPSNLLMCKLMQVCCSEIENENSRVAAINSVLTYFLNNYWGWIRFVSMHPPHRDMLLDEM